jgi:uncharacterized membrane protein
MSVLTQTLQQPFPSIASMRAEHRDLLKRFHEELESESYSPEIISFIERGVKSGALLDQDQDRQNAQTLLDYWGTRLYRLTGDDVENILDDFDPELAPELEDALCPYLGLDAFVEGKQQYFFGRQGLLDKLVPMVNARSLVIVVGSSGSGKSSLVRAGLIPALKQDGFPETAWQYLPPIVPGPHPLESLRAALAQVEGQQNLVVVIDQFEETFTLCLDEQERRAFVGALVGLIEDQKAANRLILTLRTDFESQMARLPELNQEANYFRVTPLNASELRDAIHGPASLIGLKFDDGLVDALLNDILGEPAALPLLQFTLLKLWENRARNRITWESYRRLGGGRLALARSADEFYNKQLLPEDQPAARQILMRLVRPGEGLEITSNRMQRQNLYSKTYARDRMDRVLEKFVKARLLRLTPGKTPEQDQVEVAHEALIRNWPTLVDLLDKERERLRERRLLTSAADQWQALGQDDSALLRGTILAEALKYDDLNELESLFVQKSQAAEQAEELAREEARQREARNARRVAQIANSGVILTVALPLGIGLFIFAVIKDTDNWLVMLGTFISALVIVVMMARIAFLSFANTTIGQWVNQFLDQQIGQRFPVFSTPESFENSQPDVPQPVRKSAVIAYYLPFLAISKIRKRKTGTKFELFHAIQAAINGLLFGLFVLIILAEIMLSNDASADYFVSGLIMLLLLPAQILTTTYIAVQAYRGKYPRYPLLGNVILNRMDRKNRAVT